MSVLRTAVLIVIQASWGAATYPKFITTIYPPLNLFLYPAVVAQPLLGFLLIAASNCQSCTWIYHAGPLVYNTVLKYA